jgi:hypothetical protein
MLQFETIRNPEAEVFGAPVVVSSALCEEAGIALAYAGLFGVVVGVEAGECLVGLDKASHKRFVSIEQSAFSMPFCDAFCDLDEAQWFVSGVLEVVK